MSTTAPILAPAAELPDWARQAVNLADLRLGAIPLTASDQFFAPLERMLKPEPAAFIPGLYDDNGKWMDGWETRRKRTTGHDWSVIKLARRGVIQGFDVDTSHFTGNYAPAVSIEATDVAGDALDTAVWTEVLPATSLQGNRHHLLPITNRQGWTHLRIHIYPDGGIARLRVYGQVTGVFAGLPAGSEVDLAAALNGARAVAWNDAHYGQPANLLLPGRGVNMGDGWETRRRREPGHDWCVLALAAPGVIERLEVDTAHFKGNYPDRCSIQAALVEGGTDQSLITQSMFWPLLLPEQPLSMDAIHEFTTQIVRLGPVSHVRFNIHPDGGVSRLRLWGRVGA